MKNMKKLISVFLATLLALSTLAVVPFTASAATATPDWYDADADVLEVDSYEDLLAFAAASVADNGYLAGKTIALTADIDLDEKTWTKITRFDGTLDGQGHAIKNLTMSGKSYLGFFQDLKNGATIKNISFSDASIEATTAGGHVISAVVTARAQHTVTFENVYVGGTITIPDNSFSYGGYVGQVYASSTVNFNNCVSDVTFNSAGSRCGGFVGLPNNPTATDLATVNYEDCAFTGDMSKVGGYSSAFSAYSYVNQTLTRCVALGKLPTTGAMPSVFVTQLGDNNGTAPRNTERVLNITDCYTVNVGKGELIQAQGAAAGAAYCVDNVTFTAKYGENEKVIATPGTALSTKIAEFKTFFTDNGGYLTAVTTSATWTAETFAATYPVLANNGWIATGKTVTFADGATVPEILPKGVAAIKDNAAVKVAFVQANEDGSAIRFVNAVAGMTALNAFDAVGYEVTVAEGETVLVNAKQVSTTKLLTSITADGLSKTVAELNAANEGLNADYLVALSLNGFKTDGTAYTVTVKPFVQSGDLIIYGTAVTGTVVNGVFTQAQAQA